MKDSKTPTDIGKDKPPSDPYTRQLEEDVLLHTRRYSRLKAAYDELKQDFDKLSHDYDELQQKYDNVTQEKEELQDKLTEAENNRKKKDSEKKKKRKKRREDKSGKKQQTYKQPQQIVNCTNYYESHLNNSRLNTGKHMKIGNFNGNNSNNSFGGDQYNATGGATQNNHCTIHESTSAPLTVTDTKVKEAIITLRQENKWEKQMYWAVWKVLMARKIVNKRAEEFANYLINIGAEKDNVYNNIRRIDTECNNIAHVTATQWTDYYDRYDGNHNKQILVAKRFIELLDS